jgi:cytochrome oxidase Cu insertion factor (SCO1/SenC/PrrC family)
MVGWITGAVFFSAVMFASQGARGADPYEALSVLRIHKKPAPDFSLPTVNGSTVTLAGYQGKVVLLGFFKTF